MKPHIFVMPAVLVLLAARAASAQSSDPYFTDMSASYDVIYHEPGVTSHAGAHFDIASTLKRDVPFIGPVGEVGINHFPGGTTVSLLGGLRLRANVDRRILPFAQAVLGLDHCGVCGVNDFALQGGGGLDFRTSRNRFRIRTQIDVRHVFDQARGFTAVRASAGIVFPLNK